jgi:murein DD-endopeptidase MepM/ murein hydrolase activator NlpD
MYANQKKYIDFDDEEKSINIIKLLLSSSIISDVPKNNEYLRIAGNLGKEVLSTTQELADQQNMSLGLLEEKSEKLERLEKKLDLQKKIIVTQKEAKTALIAFTRGSEEAYQSLLREARNEQEEILREIKSYQGNLREVNALLDVDTDPPDLISQGVFSWPVEPNRGLSSYFKDEEYEEKFGMVHNAIDIRTPEGTEIEAPADGYVYKIHDGEKGYSYMILAHRNNTLTVYGHLLEFTVTEGDIVDKGDTIGLSGGRPGTPGAGYLTTGPHLHFEVYDDGKHIDPLSVLNINKIPDEYLPDSYL